MPRKKTAPQPDRLTISYPLEGFTPEALENLKRMIAAKEPLIKLALGAETLPINITEEAVEFHWFRADAGEEAIAAYTQFIAQICLTAKGKKRVTAAVRDFSNPRFSFRVWLISLGMVGPNFSAARRVLCKALPGNGAWSSGVDPRRKSAGEPAAESVAEPAGAPVAETATEIPTEPVTPEETV